MSISRHHVEWLALVPNSGPFLSLPVLTQAFPQGLDAHDPEHGRRLRLAFAEWDENQSSSRPDPAIHQAWIRFVLNETLGYEDLLTEGQAIPQTLMSAVEYGETLRPDLVVNDPTAKKARLLVKTYSRRQSLTKPVSDSRWKVSPETRMMQLLHDTGIRLGLVTNGEHWLLVNAPRGETSGYASWYAHLWLEEPLTQRAFRTLLGAERLFGVSINDTFEALLDRSSSDQQEVTDQLGYQVRKAVEVLVQAIDKADQDHRRQLLTAVDEKVLYEAALTVMMRLVFLFCAEERELLLLGDDLWDRNYAVSTLREQLREAADQHGEEILGLRHDAWVRLLTTFRAVYGGVSHDRLKLPAYGGSLFNPDRFPFLEGRPQNTCWRDTQASPLPVSNRTVLHLLEALQMLQVRLPGGGKTEARKLSFRSIDIEQIGHVYEGLLDHTAKRATEPVLGLQGTRDKEPEIPLAELEEASAKGESSLLDYLKDKTGRSLSALKKGLTATLDTQWVSRLRTVCQDGSTLSGVEPWAGLVREDTMSYPMVITPGSVYVTAGTDRRSTGTHYTPKSLTEPIVQYTLEPLVYEGPAEGWPKEKWKLRSAKELLELKICDMACGSGAFLVQTCRYMAARLMEAWEAAERASPDTVHITPEGEISTGQPNERLIPRDPDERQIYALRIVAQRCVYGVDKNPLAGEMAKLSLWLLTLAKDRPFEFLDHAIRCGDSLVGIHNLDQLRKFNLDGTGETASLFLGFLDKQIQEAIALRLKLASMQADKVEDVEAQDRLLHEADERIEFLRAAADLLVEAEFAPGSASDKRAVREEAWLLVAKHVNGGNMSALRHEARGNVRELRMFHWSLEFPEAVVGRAGFDAFVGNPPFVGGRRIIRTFGENYQHGLRRLFPSLSANADFCTYFFHRAFQATRAPGYFGFLATKTIAEGDTRESGLDQLLTAGAALFRASTFVPWPGSASVLISLLFLSKRGWADQAVLNGLSVPSITGYLTPTDGAHDVEPFHLESRAAQVFQGCAVAGDGFLLSEAAAHKLLADQPRNAEVVRPYITGSTFCNDPFHKPTGWIIHFFDRSEVEAREYRDCYLIVEKLVRPYRMGVRRDAHRRYWWQFGDKRPTMFKAIAGLARVLVNARVAKYIAFDFLPADLVYLNTLHIFPFSDYGHFALLQSTLHETWALARTSSVGVTPQYTPVDCYYTFPFPDRRQITSLETAGGEYQTQRRRLMELGSMGLTDIYNLLHDPTEFAADVQALRVHRSRLDRSVLAAYGWSDLDLGHGFHETKQGIRFTISEPARREVLARLLKLNHERYEEEVRQGLHDKKKAKGSKGLKKQATSPGLFDTEEG